ncbi:hypothetical protein LIA77_07564 [Sarocladium implicatum]|nr:hypothetical protein LIA77_07564 [Sarocladium implicatum]
MSSDSAATTPGATTPTGAAAPAGFGEGRGITFSIKTGGARYKCTLQDRSHYERMKAARQNSSDSTTSTSTTSSSASSTH